MVAKAFTKASIRVQCNLFLKFLCKESKVAGIISIFQTNPGSVAGRRLHSEHEAAAGKD